LEACEGCYTGKLSYQTGERGGRNKKVMEKRGSKKPRDSSESEEESNMSGKEWLRNFSTMKVGPPRHVKHAAEHMSQPGSQGDQLQDNQPAGQLV